jgi:hypothetical protein
LFCFCFVLIPPPRAAARAAFRRPPPPRFSIWSRFRPRLHPEAPPRLPDHICTIAASRRPPPRRDCSYNRRTSADPDLRRHRPSDHRMLTAPPSPSGKPPQHLNSGRRCRRCSAELRLRLRHKSSSSEQLRRRRLKPKVSSDSSSQGGAGVSSRGAVVIPIAGEATRGRRPRNSNKRAAGVRSDPLSADLTR